MPVYIYTARDSGTGNTVHGNQEADSEYAAIRILQSRNLLIFKIASANLDLATATRSHRQKRHKKARSKDLLFFVRQTATLLIAGVPVLRALEIIVSQVDSQSLQEALKSVIEDIKAGSTFRGALSKHPKIFPSLWVFLIEAGETSGNLPMVLNQLADYIEAGTNLKTKIVSAMVYPSVVIGVAIVAVLVFMLKLIPIFSKLFSSFNAKLPPLTLVVISVSEFFQHYILYLALVVGVAAYFLKRYINTPSGSKALDRLMLKIPIFGELVRDIILARISITLSTLTQSGVNLLESIDISSRAAGNSLYESALKNVGHDIQQGKSLSTSLAENALFPPMVVQMVMVGEESGQLPDMIKRVAEYYQLRVDIFVSRLGTLIEPIILVVVGGFVGVLVVAMFLPIFTLSSVVK